jgi:hypothetical protein
MLSPLSRTFFLYINSGQGVAADGATLDAVVWVSVIHNAQTGSGASNIFESKSPGND